MRPLLLPFLAALCLFSAGCREREVTTYRVPREKDATPPAAASAASAAPAAPATSAPPATTPAPSTAPATMANTAVPTATGGNLTWTAPAHWEAKAASAMRKGTYVVPAEGTPGELAITAFPGDVGGEAANLNRWRTQIQLPPASAAELAAAVTRFESGGLNFTVVDFENGQQRVLGAIVPFAGGTWFFKLTGPTAPIAKEKPAFLAFLKTVKAPAAP